MILAHPNKMNKISFRENEIKVLVIENRSLLSSFVSELNSQIQNGMGEFVLSHEEKELKIDKSMELVIDFFNLSLNNRKIISKLYKELQDHAYGEKLYLKTMEIISQIQCYVINLEDELDLSISYEDEVKAEDLFKAIGICIQEEGLSFVEKVLKYAQMTTSMLGIKVIVFLNLKSFLTEEELDALYLHFIQEKIFVLLLESSLIGEKRKYENITIIDSDLCEI